VDLLLRGRGRGRRLGRVWLLRLVLDDLLDDLTTDLSSDLLVVSIDDLDADVVY